MRKSHILTVIILLTTLVFFTGAAQGAYEELDIYKEIPCVADGNNSHITASALETFYDRYDAVCQADQFDWYIFDAAGDGSCGAMMMLVSDAPGIAIRAYYDNGSGLTQLTEVSPVLDTADNFYKSQIAISSLCQTKGIASPYNGKFYIRITYWSSYTGNHAYRMVFQGAPLTAIAGGQNDLTKAKAVNIGGSYIGILDNNDKVDFYYWNHPSNQQVDGFLELYTPTPVTSTGPNTPLHMDLLNASGAPIGYSQQKTGEGRLALDMASLKLNPAKYYIKIYLDSSYTGQVLYRLKNYADRGASDGYGVDADNTAETAKPIGFYSPVASSICWPRDEKDYYYINNDRFFIGDIQVKHSCETYGVMLGGERWGEKLKSEGSFSILDFGLDPVPPGGFNVFVDDMSASRDLKQYTIEVIPNGAGPYHAPGYASWDKAGDLPNMDEMTFDLQQGVQSVIFFHADTQPTACFAGPIEIIGSQADFEVRAGKPGTPNPVWSGPMIPGPNGRAEVWLGLDIPSSPGNALLRIKMNDGATGRRRFYFKENILGYTPPPPGMTESFSSPGGGANYDYSSEQWSMFGAFYPPASTVHYRKLTINNDGVSGVPVTYWMTVKAGYPGMTFKLMDMSKKVLWQTTITEQGGVQKIDLSDYTQNGKDYILEVSTTASEQKLVFWRAEMGVPPMLMAVMPPEGVIERPETILDHIDPGQIKKKN
jgi:hypothetical protein